MARRLPRSLAEIMARTPAAGLVGWNPAVLEAIAGLIRSQTGVDAVVPPWQGTVAILQVSHPADRKLLSYRQAQIIGMYNEVLGSPRIHSLKIRVVALSGDSGKAE